MRVETCRDRLWTRLIRPILWPVLLAQALLVLFCLAIGLTLWSLMPAPVSWSTTFWLLLVLLAGSSLNVTVFLMLLKQRLRGVESDVNEGLWRVEAFLARQGPLPSAGLPSPVGGDGAWQPLRERLEGLVGGLEALIAQWREDLEAGKVGTRRLADDLTSLQQCFERLETGQARAREASRLKSNYLAHLQQTMAPLMGSLARLLDSERFRQCGSADDQADLQHLRTRLAEATALLAHLSDFPDSRPPAPSSGRRRLLIVDDGPVNLMLAQQVLERQGLSVVTATSGTEALAWLEREAFDLVLMDIFMPAPDGLQTCRRWRAREAELARSPRSVLVALTASASEADRWRFREAGMDDCLAKPYCPRDLIGIVQRWLPALHEEAR
ncbi:response regulator [Halomonas cerina]|uniref:CheY-like chemotaxis protein n=1 Tax=Halomonas cerina TaxID=447424 RepID=A0A839VAW8_9GAMM|nr:response regulator [Halomonas cerina]MBB3189646.1 CheY-like chemotaxis protein [Halomonas cerina]